MVYFANYRVTLIWFSRNGDSALLLIITGKADHYWYIIVSGGRRQSAFSLVGNVTIVIFCCDLLFVPVCIVNLSVLFAGILGKALESLIQTLKIMEWQIEMIFCVVSCTSLIHFFFCTAICLQIKQHSCMIYFPATLASSLPHCVHHSHTRKQNQLPNMILRSKVDKWFSKI